MAYRTLTHYLATSYDIEPAMLMVQSSEGVMYGLDNSYEYRKYTDMTTRTGCHIRDNPSRIQEVHGYDNSDGLSDQQKCIQYK